MGALAEGFALARQRREDEIAEVHRKETLVDSELHELAGLIAQDSAFLNENGIACDVGRRIMRVSHRRTPAVTVHFNPESQEFTMTVMHDGSVKVLKTTDECARAIGAALFDVISVSA
jgi:hypothetical protein